MRKCLPVAVMLMCWTSIQAQSSPAGDSLAAAGKVGTAYPAFTLRKESGVLKSEDLRGKVIWINFWFEACKPCMAEMAAIDESVRSFRNNPDFVMLSLTWEDLDAIQRVQSKYPMSYPVYTITEDACERLNGGRGYPTNVVVDRGGVIRYIETGGKTDPAKAREDIQQFIIPVIEHALRK